MLSTTAVVKNVKAVVAAAVVAARQIRISVHQRMSREKLY